MRRLHQKKSLSIWLQVGLIGIAAIFTGCGEENILTEPEVMESVYENPQLARALEMADQFFSELSGTTRATKRTVQSIERISNNKTRNASFGDSIFLINYDGNQGFALLDIRTGAEEIYAISQEGKLAINDTIGNPVLKDFFDGVMAYGVTPPSGGPAINDSLSFSLDWKYSITKRVARPLNNWVSEWDEISYKKNSPIPPGSGSPALSGTGPIAMAKILAYYKFPPKIKAIGGNDYEVEWESIISTRNNNEICKILPLLGQAVYGLSSMYGTFFTSTDPTNFKDAFRNLNFWAPCFNMSRWTDSEQKVISYMENGSGKYKAGPIIAYANRPTSNEYESTPFWIIDCILEREKFLVGSSGSPILSSIKSAPTLMHFIWGDGKTPNGYFAYIVKPYPQDGVIDSNIYKPNNTIEGKIIYTFSNLHIIGGWYSPGMD